MSDLFISTGEASGDAVGAGIARHILAFRPGTVIEGLGSDRMEAAGVRLWANTRGYAAIGITQAIPLAPRLYALQQRLKRRLADHRPGALVLVDYGAFNVRLGRWAREIGIPTVYAMPPGSWRRQPSPAGTARLIQAADMFLSPFAWNAVNLCRAGAHAIHVGHPVLELGAATDRSRELADELRPVDGRLIALLPGSRTHEVATLAPRMIAAARLWPHEEDRFVMVQAPSFPDEHFERIIARHLPRAWREKRFRVARQRASDVFPIADLGVVCSGTATLEAAAAGTPFVVVYDGPAVMRLEWRLRKRRVRAPFIAMPNIIAGRGVVPELIAEAATAGNIVAALSAIADDPSERERMRAALDEVRSALKPEGALAACARHIMEFAGLSAASNPGTPGS